MTNQKLSTATFALGIALGTSCLSPVGAKTPIPATTFNQLVVFGDSLSDQGNFLPLTGGTFPNLPYFFPGRFSNGEVWNGYLAEDLGLSSNTINYALGGATTGSGNISPVPIGLQQQITAFQNGQDLFGQPVSFDPDALYTLWAGANDYLIIEEIANKKAPKEEIVPETIDNLSSALEIIAEAGARHIVVPNLFELNLTPLVAGSSPENQEILADIVQLHNNLLDKELKDLSKTFPNTNFILFDSYTFFEDLFADPEALGFANTTEGCTKTNLYDPVNILPDPTDLYNQGCSGDPAVQDTYTWWDSVHPTTAVHELIAESVLAILPVSSEATLPPVTAANSAANSATVPEPTSPASLLGIGILGAIAAAWRHLLN